MGNTAMVTQKRRTQPVECQQYCTNLKEKVFIAEDLSFGDPLGVRTQDPNIKSVVLYQLS